MNKRTIDGMIAYFNQEVSKMDIAREYKMALLGMITSIGFESKKQEVVRCGGCKWYKEGYDIDGKWFSRCNGSVRTYGHTPPDWFCADGERRES